MEKIIQLSPADHHPTSLDEGLVVDAVEKNTGKKQFFAVYPCRSKKGK